MLTERQPFGKYRIVELLGRGGTGVVYLAEDTILKRRVALKLLDGLLTMHDTLENVFLHEAQTVASFSHPNIVPIHSLERVEGELVIDMAFMEGGSLSGVLGRGAPGPWLAVRFAFDILQALACCHDAGIVHRDVKPANVLLDSSGRALLSDFGLARLLHSHLTESIRTSSSTGFFVGTPRYAPVEAWDGWTPTPAWDVYSVGMILFETTTGNTPFSAETSLALLKQIQECPVPPLRTIQPEASPELEALVEAMLQRDPGARPANATEALRQICETPEFEALRSDSNRTLHPGFSRPVVAALGRFKRRYGLRVWSRAFAMAALGVLCVIAGAITFTRVGLLSLHAVRPRVPALSTDTVPLLYEAKDVESSEQAIGLLWIGATDEAGAFPVISSEVTGLWSGRLIPAGPGRFTMEAGWGGYTDASAHAFQYGTLTGEVAQLAEGPDLMLTATFRSGQDASTFSRVFVLQPSKQEVTPAEFLANLQRSGFFLPVLYNELLPRNLAWADELERRVSTRGTADATASLSSPGQVTCDGQLSEAVWQRATAITPDDATREGASLYVAYDSQSMYLGLRLKGAPRKPRIRCTILPRFGIPLSQSPSWIAELENNVVVVQRQVVRGAEIPWICRWQAATAETDGGWSAETEIPFDDFGEDVTGEGVRAGDHWRIHVSVVDGDPPNAGAVARWGTKDPNPSEPGVIVEFGAT